MSRHIRIPAAVVCLVSFLFAGCDVTDNATIRSKDIEVTVRADGCGLIDEVKYRGEVVMSTTMTGRTQTPGFQADARQAAALAKNAGNMLRLKANAPCRMSEAISPRGHKLITIENGLLKVTFMTWFGGRVIRLESKLTGANFLDNPYEDRPGEVKEPKDIGGIWGELSDKIFQLKIGKETDDEIVVVLSGTEEQESAGVRTARKVEKTLRIRRGSPALVIEQKHASTEGTRTMTNHLFARLQPGGSVGPEDVLWGSSRGRAMLARKRGTSPNVHTNPKTDHWAAVSDTKNGTALVTVFDGPIHRIGAWIKTNFYQLEHFTAEFPDMSPGKEVKTTVRFIPCFNMGGVSFANEQLALGIIPESDVVGAGSKTWRIDLAAVAFTRTARKVTLKPRVVDSHGNAVKDLPAVTVTCPFLVAKHRTVNWPVGELPPGHYDVRVSVTSDGKEIGRTTLGLRRLGGGPVLDVFHPDPTEAHTPFPVLGSTERGKIELTSVRKLDAKTIRVTGRHVFPKSTSPFTTEIQLNTEGDGFEIRHTLVCNEGEGNSRIRAAGLEMPLSLGDNYYKVRTTVGGEKLNDTWRVDQTDEMVSTTLVSDWFSRWPLWKLGGVLQDTPTHYRIWKASAWDVAPTTTLEGNRAPGWVETNNGRWGMRIEMPRMAEKAPKEILVDGHAGSAWVYFHPPHVPPLTLARSGDASAPSLAERLGWRRGAPWTNTVRVRFHTGPHTRGFKRELSDKAFRALLEALGETTVTRSMRRLTLPGGTFEECIQNILDSEVSARTYIRRVVGGGYRLKGLCRKLACKYDRANTQQTVDDLIRTLKEKRD